MPSRFAIRLSSFRLRVAASVVPAVLVALLLPGCGEETRGGPRVPTYPVTGTVHVDGQPVAQVAVTCRLLDESNKKTPLTPSAFTDEEGQFAIGTYESDDGAPVGTYKLTFRWGQRNLLSGRYEGDRFQGRYATAEKSSIEFTVREGEPTDLGVIALSTKQDQ